MQGWLRKTLHGTCDEVRRVGTDRVVRLRFGDHTILLELTGRHGNLFILDADDRLLASLLPNRSHRRQLEPGLAYVPPASDPPTARSARFSSPDVGAQIAEHYEQLERTEILDARRSSAARVLRNALKRLRRKASRQRVETDRAGEADTLRRQADLLNAHFGQLRRGMESVQLDDVFEDDCPRVTIPLDPARDPRDQIERLYKSARRMERGTYRAMEELERTEAELAEAESTLDRLEGAGDVAEIDRIVEGLPRRWQPQQRGARRGKPEERLPFRRYRTAAGHEILVGRSGADNDTLTFRHARGRDIWLHVVGRPGAHVVVPSAASSPEPATLRAAAQLALAHSGFREGDTAEVAWTQVKYVRKVKGAAPGLVTYTQEKVMYVKREREALAGVEGE
jgi:predicted ribosome quality control (RQC) complex YloA/Tae2 family protein